MNTNNLEKKLLNRQTPYLVILSLIDLQNCVSIVTRNFGFEIGIFPMFGCLNECYYCGAFSPCWNSKVFCFFTSFCIVTATFLKCSANSLSFSTPSPRAYI